MKLSVVVAAYNEEKLIGKCIKAIKEQNYPRKDYEIIIVDNNSTDKTAQIAKKMGARVFIEEHQGVSYARNKGLMMAKGEIIAITDADSAPNKDWLLNIEKLMEDNSIQLLGGKVMSSDRRTINIALLEIFDKVAKLLDMLHMPLVWGPNMAVRKKSLNKTNGFNTNVKMSEDWEFAMRTQKEFGAKSVIYTDRLVVDVSPRKFKKISIFVPYFINGVLSFISIFIFKKAWKYGTFVNIR